MKLRPSEEDLIEFVDFFLINLEGKKLTCIFFVLIFVLAVVLVEII